MVRWHSTKRIPEGSTVKISRPLKSGPSSTGPTVEAGECEAERGVVSSANSASTMGKLLDTVSKGKLIKKGCRMFESPKPVGAVLAGVFTSAPKLNAKSDSRRSTVPRKSGSISREKVSLSLVKKLRENVIRKKVNWQHVELTHPSLERLGVWQRRCEWTKLFLSNSAVPVSVSVGDPAKNSAGHTHHASGGDSLRTLTEIFVCSAPTGSGKSSLIPLFLLDSHWERILQRMDASSEMQAAVSFYHNDAAPGSDSQALAHTSPPLVPFPVNVSTREYATTFAFSSRLCIVVSQPTRLACMELAKFTTTILASCSLPPETSHVGGRVGYAVGGDSCFSAGSEIIYATPGYILNMLQDTINPLFPTTLIIDEAHCRDMETDLLLAWAKKQLLGTQQQEQHRDAGLSWSLRHLILMSATLSAEQMVSYLTEVQPRAGALTSVENCLTFCKPQILSVHEAAQELLKEGTDDAPQHSSVARGPYRLKEYFVDDLPDALESLQLFAGDDPYSDDTTWRQSPRNTTLCPLTSPPARRVMVSLAHFFSYARFSPEIHLPQARALAQFILFMLQSIATSSKSVPRIIEEPLATEDDKEGTHCQSDAQPESILVFLPGFTEITLVMHCIELLCQKMMVNGREKDNGQQYVGTTGSTSKNNGDLNTNWTVDYLGAGNTTFLEYEGCPFSVALLHATAVGSPQQQLRETMSPFPYRIILSTNVAESSVTIPSVRCVIDSCLERRFLTDPLTGVTLRSTTVVSVSSLRQRAGRGGRTCDSVVIHLAPKRMFAVPKESSVPCHPNNGTRKFGLSEGHSCVGEKVNFGSGEQSPFVTTTDPPDVKSSVPTAPVHTAPESAAANVTAVLLRVKYLFPQQPSSLLSLLPDAPKPKATARAVNQLIDLGFLQHPSEATLKKCGGVYHFSTSFRKPPADPSHMVSFYDSSSLSAKGEFVAYLPIPYEQALLLYHSLQFACIEDGLLVACAMTVPSLFIYPRVTTHGGDVDASEGAPAAQYLQSIVTQRSIAAKIGGGTRKDSGHTLSEPLMLLSILHEWYACASDADMTAFLRRFRLNRRALRVVDASVAQCALRLWRLVAKASDHEKAVAGGTVYNSVEVNDEGKTFSLCGEHDRVERRPSTSLIERLISSVFPESYLALLANSLLRLHRCALERSTNRLSLRHRTMIQWYPHDEQLILKLQASFPGVGRHKHKQERPLLVFGATQDRLCAAFVAAYARNTMRGEETSHHLHQRRLLRNLGALHGDGGNTCSFSVELHAGHHRHQLQHSLYERLTPEVLREVITPYLVGTNVQQIELFSSRHSGLVRFGGGVNGCRDENEKEGGSYVEQSRLLVPVSLPCDPAGLIEVNRGRKLCAIELAPVGISLLVCIQSVLSRLVALLPPVSPPSSSLGNLHVSSERDGGAKEMKQIPGVGKPEEVSPSPGSQSNFSRKLQNSNRSLTFTETAGDSSTKPDTRVTWYDSYGQEHTLLLSDVKRMGYEELFPEPFEAVANNACNTPRIIYPGSGDSTSLSFESEFAPLSDEDGSCAHVGDDKQHALLSVQRVTFSGAVQWKVTLPAPSFSTQRSFSPSAEDEKFPNREEYYCWVCHNLWFREEAFRNHCRTLTHLSRLSFAVKSGMRCDWVESFCSGTLSDLILRRRNANEVSKAMGIDTTVELRSCSVSPLSFLNSLRWRPLEGASATLPMAVAGALVGNTHVTATAGTWSTRGSRMMLQALHVWVLDAEQPRTSDKLFGHKLPQPLFVLAGYLAAASQGFEAAVLVNNTHTRAYAVMLHDWGVWRFSTPLNAQQLKCVMAVYAGNPWRGVYMGGETTYHAERPAATRCDDSTDQCCEESIEGSVCGESLHWCVVCDVCPQCTYCGSGETGQKTNDKGTNTEFNDDAPSAVETVQSTLLIVLHEYKNSLRNVVSFTDYIQRVVAKLNAWSAIQQAQLKSGGIKQKPKRFQQKRSATAVECCKGAELLARFVASRQGQSIENLLRDIGCQFLSPAAAPATVIQSDGETTTTTNLEGNPIHGNEGTNEKLFLIPTMLPSYLPSPNFAELLHHHRLTGLNLDGTPASDVSDVPQMEETISPEDNSASLASQIKRDSDLKRRQTAHMLF